MGEINSRAELTATVLAFERKACKVPKEYDNMIVDIVTHHILSLGIALGNLELCYLRTKQYHDLIEPRKE